MSVVLFVVRVLTFVLAVIFGLSLGMAVANFDTIINVLTWNVLLTYFYLESLNPIFSYLLGALLGASAMVVLTFAASISIERE